MNNAQMLECANVPIRECAWICASVGEIYAMCAKYWERVEFEKVAMFEITIKIICASHIAKFG